MFQSVPDPIFMDICGNKFCRILCHIRTISHGNPMCHKFKHFHIIRINYFRIYFYGLYFFFTSNNNFNSPAARCRFYSFFG